MRKSFINLLALLASSSFVCSASAQSTYADISLGLDAQLAILQKSEQVRAALLRNVDPALASLPQVVAVMGIEGELKARLLLSNGVVMTYAEGDQINQAMRVAAVTPRQVTVAVKPSSKKAKTELVPLQFQAGATMNGAGGFPGMSQPSSVPLPSGLIPAAPVIPGMQMPAPLMQRQGQAGSAPSSNPQVQSPASVPAATAAAAPAQRRPDQDLIDAGAGK
ncbi:hypothetical protein LJR189_004720 [Acidovorax delafieldii]|uniref:hypothetical protein n=1 Tax=Acidovorax delafieldii TaxID=47920 RepID=UPI003ECD494F